MPSTALFRGGLHAAPRHELEELGWSRASPSASALLIQEAGGCVMWDCTPLVTPEVVQRIKTLGGLKAIAISPPALLWRDGGMERAFNGAPIYLHADDRDRSCASPSIV